ncbi:MAG: DUF2796 domain-containing protein [Gammaproteobacteria bacterium]
MTALALAGTAHSAGQAVHEHEHETEQLQLGAHVHGVARLTFVVEGNAIQMELQSPAANIVGFEHAPAIEADHAAIDRAVALLEDGDALFRFNAAAGCRMTENSLDSALFEASHAKQEHAHDRHEHEEEGHDNHADVAAAWRFDCASPQALEQLDIGLFEAFPGTEELRVEFIAGDRQQAAELTPASHVIRF